MIYNLLLLALSLFFITGEDCNKLHCSPMTGENTFLLKSNRLSSGTIGHNDFKIIFTNGGHYRISGCAADTKGNLAIELHSDRGLIFSNYSSASNKYYPYFDYSCGRTATYTIKCRFENTDLPCGLLLISKVK